MSDLGKQIDAVWDSDEAPDFLVTASIFAGLLAFFTSLLVIFSLTARPDELGELQSAAQEGEERLYFGGFSEIILVLNDRVEFRNVPDGDFSILTDDVPGNERIRAYFKTLAKSQRARRTAAEERRKPLFAIQPAASFNEYWIEGMAGDANVTTISTLRFHPDCLHIDDRGDKSVKTMKDCLERGR